MVKTFKIQYNGTESEIELDDKPTVGVINKILRNAERRKPNQMHPEYDAHEWFIGIATNFIKKAPWTIENPQVLNEMEWSTYERLAEILGNEFPLERFLFPGVKLLYGSKLDLAASAIQTEFTTSLQSGVSPNGK